MAGLIDSHAHLTSEAVYPQVEGVLERAYAAGVRGVVNICTDLDTLEKGLLLHEKYPWVVNTASTTPHDVEKEGQVMFEGIAEHARADRLAGVGETGLDYYYQHSPRELQQEFLRLYLRLALECNLPVVIHCREAFGDFFRILDEEFVVDGRHQPGVLHCFTGTLEEAKEVADRGWFVSMSGIVTFKKSEELRKAASVVPLEQLLIETDTPYLAPQSRRGKPNEPSYLPEVAQCLADIKKLPLDEVITATSKNAQNLFPKLSTVGSL